MKEKQVLILTSVASMIDQFIVPSIELLIEMGYKVDVACNFREGNTCSEEQIEKLKNKLTKLGVTHYQIDFNRNIKKVLDNMRAYKQVRELMKKNRYEFVHCHSPIGGVCGRLAGKATNTKIIYTAHGFHFYEGAPKLNWAIYYPMEKWLSKYTDCLITINEEDYNTAISRQFKANIIKRVHGVGINLDKFHSQSVDKKERMRISYGYKENDFILFYAAELNNNKHQDLIINAVGLLKDKIPNIKLLLAGIGPLEKEYKEQVEELNITPNVEFLGYRNDVPNLLMLSDIAVSSSRREGLPVNVMEAMAIGLPLVVTNVRGNRELVKNKQNGYVLRADDIEGFAYAIDKLYNDYDVRRKFAEKSIELVQKYSLKNVKNEMKSIYKT